MPKASEVKKLVSVLATSTPVTEARKKADEIVEAVETAEAIEFTEVSKGEAESKDKYLSLAQVPYIWYPITFRKKSVSILALLDLGSEVNAIHLTLA